MTTRRSRVWKCGRSSNPAANRLNRPYAPVLGLPHRTLLSCPGRAVTHFTESAGSSCPFDLVVEPALWPVMRLFSPLIAMTTTVAHMNSIRLISNPLIQAMPAQLVVDLILVSHIGNRQR